MVEVEMKFPTPDFAALERWLAQQSAEPEAPHREEDLYFKPPDRDFAQTDEALRLRRRGGENVLTYKGPKRDAQTKTRTEIEVPLADGAGVASKCMQLFQNLRYQAVATVRKERRIYRLEREGFAMEVCLDNVESVGTYAELEILAEEENVDAARAVLLRIASELNLGASERRSYLELLLTKKAEPK